MKHYLLILSMGLGVVLMLNACSQAAPEEEEATGEFEDMVSWGEHLVTIAGCHDCHTPKVMTDHGPILDSSRLLSGHPAGMPKIEIDNAGMEAMGLAVTRDLTEWIGPWGTSYTANLTPHETGIGNWEEANFMKALREGKYKGIDGGRMLLPPMPWEMFRHMTDNEIKAIYSYLRTLTPIDNAVPPPKPPASAMMDH